jgi:hypothetical protein
VLSIAYLSTFLSLELLLFHVVTIATDGATVITLTLDRHNQATTIQPVRTTVKLAAFDVADCGASCWGHLTNPLIH